MRPLLMECVPAVSVQPDTSSNPVLPTVSYGLTAMCVTSAMGMTMRPLFGPRLCDTLCACNSCKAL